jgi:hypothetical protein
LKLNPSLEPVFVRWVYWFPPDENWEPILFTVRRISFCFFFREQDDRIAIARRKLADQFAVAETLIEILHHSTKIVDSDFLSFWKEYFVNVTAPMTIVDIAILGGKAIFAEKVYLSREMRWTSSGFIGRFLGLNAHDAVIERVIQTDGHQTRERAADLFTICDTRRLEIRIPPCFRACYVLTSGIQECETFEIEATEDTLVRDAAVHLAHVLEERGVRMTLPDLFFCGQLLNYNEKLSTYQIPPGAQIQYREPSLTVQRLLPDRTRYPFSHGKSTRVLDLRARLPIEPPEFLIFMVKGKSLTTTSCFPKWILLFRSNDFSLPP